MIWFIIIRPDGSSTCRNYLEDAGLLLTPDGILPNTVKGAVVLRRLGEELQLGLETALREVPLILPFLVFTTVEEPTKTDCCRVCFYLETGEGFTFFFTFN